MTAIVRATAILLLSAGLATAAAAADDCPRSADAAKVNMPPPAAMPKMAMDKPMPTDMAKPGTMPMDVTGAAADKEHCMRPMLDKEQAAMPAAKPDKK